MKDIYLRIGEPIEVYDESANIYEGLDSLNKYESYKKSDSNLTIISVPSYLIEDIESLDENERFYFTFTEIKIGSTHFKYYDIVLI